MLLRPSGNITWSGFGGVAVHRTFPSTSGAQSALDCAASEDGVHRTLTAVASIVLCADLKANYAATRGLPGFLRFSVPADSL